MKAPVNSPKYASVVVACLLCTSVVKAQSQHKDFETFQKNPIPIVATNLGKEDMIDPYSTTEMDYHGFEEEGKSRYAATKGDWYLKYKKMFDFRCKEPFLSASPTYTKQNYLKSSYKFRLVDNQNIEDSIQFLLDKYLSNNKDTLTMWGLPTNAFDFDMEKLTKRLGTEHFKIVIAVFDSKKHSSFIDVPEAEQMNDIMTKMEVFKYPAPVDIFSYNFKINNWEYIESVTVAGDHELELYVLQKFEPRYLENCE